MRLSGRMSEFQRHAQMDITCLGLLKFYFGFFKFYSEKLWKFNGFLIQNPFFKNFVKFALSLMHDVRTSYLK